MNGSVLHELYSANEGYGRLSLQEVDMAVKRSRDLHQDVLLQFSEVSFYEPPKEELAKHKSESGVFHAAPRRARVVAMCLETNTTTIDIVDVGPEQQTSSKTTVLKDVQPSISGSDFELVDQLCRAYKPLNDAVEARGLDPKYITVEPWCVGPEYPPTERIVWATMFYYDQRPVEDGNGPVDHIPYARPIEGIEIRISLTQKKIIRFNDSAFRELGVPIPGSRDTSNARYCAPEDERTDLKPIVITQPAGPSWTVVGGNTVEWQGFRLQVGFNSKEGCSLHFVEFDKRPVVHRLSVCEMVVPYGDPRSPHYLKNAFDAGEDGLGRNTNSLELGCDCLGLIHYFDANIVGDTGESVCITNAVCMHEEDAGMAWKHTDWRDEMPHQRRNRRLVISFICTVSNYEYGFYYHLYLDGSIELEIKLTGIISTGALWREDEEAGGVRKYGTALGGKLYAPVHQHFFVSRLEMAIDGAANNITELNCERETEGSHNPHNSGFYFTETALGSELGAIRDCSSAAARCWKVSSTQRTNFMGKATAYKFMPSNDCVSFIDTDKATYLARAKFLKHQMWVTAYDREENYPGGDFPNQSLEVDGLPKWTQKDRCLVDEQLVIWHVAGTTHLPSLEDWPIMPVEHMIAFKLKPSGFFDSSRIMDLPYVKKVSTSAPSSCSPTDSNGSASVPPPPLPPPSSEEKEKEKGCCAAKNGGK